MFCVGVKIYAKNSIVTFYITSAYTQLLYGVSDLIFKVGLTKVYTMKIELEKSE